MKNITKILILVLAFWQAIFQTAYPAIILAQETSQTDSQVNVVLETGDASSLSVGQSDANIAQTEVTAGSDSQTIVNTQQTVGLETNTTADGTSGTIVVDNVDSSLSAQTGDTNSQALSCNLDNVNDVAVYSNDSESLESVIDQNVNLNSTSSATSLSGDNNIESENITNAVTGDALSVANNLNVANLNLLGSNTLFYTNTIVGEQEGDIDVCSLYQDLMNLGNSLPENTTVSVDQTASLDTKTTSEAKSGNNEIEGTVNNAETGDAVSVANSFNLANLNLVGANGVVLVVNILGSLLGNILLPNSEQMFVSNLPQNLEVINNQVSENNAQVSANSTSGTVTSDNVSGNITTGDSTAIANTSAFSNLVKIGDVWVWLLINNYGNWNGYLENWYQPGNSVLMNGGTTVLEKDINSVVDNSTEGSLSVVSNQKANVNSQTLATSTSGDVNASSANSIKTGDTYSLANDISLTNFVGIGGSFIFGIINILNDWQGNLEVTYPDLTVAVSDDKDSINPGSENKYIVTVTNQGKAKIGGVDVNFTAPSDFKLNSSEINKHIDELKPGENYSYEVAGDVLSTALINTQQVAFASVTSLENEESKDNNSATDSTLVSLPEKDKRTPDLKVSVWNNVNEFVYPGDTVLAKITVANQSPFMANDVKVNGFLSNDHPMPALPMDWDLGNLKPGEQVEIEFSIGLIDELPGGLYHLSAQAKGKAESGDESASSWFTSNFLIRLKYLANQISSNVSAKGEVLGATDEIKRSNFLLDNKKYLPYILAISAFILLFIPALKRKLNKNEK